MDEDKRATESEKRMVRSAVNELEELKRRIIRLRYWEYHTIEEIACKLHMSWANVDKIIDESIGDLKLIFFELTKEVPRQ